MQKSKYWKYSKAFSMFLLITIKTWSHLSADLECKWFPSIYTVCFEIQAQQNFKMTQDVHPFIHERFIETFSSKWIIFQNDANRPTLHLWALHQIILFKMNRVSKWRKTSTPIHGRFIETFSFIFQHDANLPTLHLWALESSRHVEKVIHFQDKVSIKRP